MVSTRTILGTRWWGTIGIVAAETRDGEWRAYIGNAPLVSEESDAQFIADWGASLEVHEANAFFPSLDSAKYKKESVSHEPRRDYDTRRS